MSEKIGEYQALARKYRPQTFADVVGQDHVLSALCNTIDAKRIHHAYLLTGTRGIGKTTIARIIAKSLECETGITSKPCLQCDACKAIAAGNYPDVIEIDAASQTKVDDTRQLLENTQYPPLTGRYKIYIIDEVHMLTNNSFNALLKTLEEPPSYVKFILATTDPHKIPTTVLSRCLQFQLKALSVDEIKNRIISILATEGVPCEIEAAQLIARAAKGSMRDALSLCDQAIALGSGALERKSVITMLGTAGDGLIAEIIDLLAPETEANLAGVLSKFAQISPNFKAVLDDLAIDKMIQGKIVMVTGAGGSIGRELCRQIASKSPELLIMVDHCEVQLFQVEQEILDYEFGAKIKPLVGNVADEARMEAVISKYRPNIIFHAAAHKHVPMMESQPGEALKNNTLGTWILAGVASRNNVEKFLLISTDKAVNPTNVMGASKRLAEKAIQAMQSRPGNKTIFVAVRFGNVLGSSGSVIPTFKKQISHGGPVTVTHPEVTRYFMTIPEAVGLVLQCAAQAYGGEIFVLNMGEPVKVIDLARQLIRLSGLEPDVDIQIKIIGLRPGEKLYEEIQHKNESLVDTPNPRIYGFVSEMPSYGEVEKIISDIKKNVDTKSVNELKRFIFTVVPEYKAQFYD